MDISTSSNNNRVNTAKEEETAAVVVNDSRSAWFTLAILSSTLLAVMFSETMLLPAIPEIMQEFNIPYSTSAWIFSAYLIVAAVMTPIAGKLSDIYGKKKVLLILLAIYVAGITAGGFANNITFLLASRVIQGVGLAAVPAAFSLLRDSFPPSKLAIAVGVFGSAYSGGSVVGLLVGASIIQHFGWHTTFFSIAPVAAIVALMIAKFVKDNGSKEARLQLLSVKGTGHTTGAEKPTIDIKGALALSATISSFLLALTLIETGISPANLPQIVGALAASAASLAAFVFIEKRATAPLLDLRLLKHKILLPSYIILMATGITMFLVYPSIVQLVRSPQPFGFGGDAVDAANVQLPFMIMFLIFASATAFIINRIGNIRPTMLGAIISSVGAFGLLAFHSTGLMVSTNLAIIATGLSLTSTAGWNIIVSSSPKEFTGISVGVGALLFFVGMAIGPALAGLYMQSYHTSPSIGGAAGGPSYPAPESYNLVFATAGLFSITTLAFSILLRRKASLMSQQQQQNTAEEKIQQHPAEPNSNSSTEAGDKSLEEEEMSCINCTDSKKRKK
ncbi:arabinose efflux permease family protein [Candidatus Nitrososphaera evergladensis SR1]|jgi:MFS family permease|uniref:Arabinose efflux permease family protein n=1 Tax=Candidatus Nitrososphaera evergladensis SR1 TaxID=1459636 RepID=A0A075MVG0_9ARCH|nr:MFS transporter [Candidatus Nitrososphaera evergladensis]AIF85220.1 arabinose efflux permease family protein [Candidatus Nitrososphaera evergladensis SR1]